MSQRASQISNPIHSGFDEILLGSPSQASFAVPMSTRGFDRIGVEVLQQSSDVIMGDHLSRARTHVDSEIAGQASHSHEEIHDLRSHIPKLKIKDAL